MLVPKFRFKCEDGTDYPEWKKTKIGNITKTFSASRVHREEWQTEGVPFWRSSDVMAYHQHKENSMGKAYISSELYKTLSSKSGKMQKDDILITGGGSIGVPYLIPNNDPLYVKDADLLCIQKSDNHYPKFLYQFFWSPSFRNYLGVISHKGTIAHYTITQINETPITLPCLEEQQKIADFLSTVDEVIAQSEAEVQNLEQQKKAAMQKIFSQEVRFKREDGTEYPEWEERELDEISEKITDGSHFSPKGVEKGYYMPSVKDMRENGFDFSQSKMISEDDFLALKKQGCCPEIGDVLIAKDGSMLKYSFTIKDNMDIVILSSIAIVRPISSMIVSDYLTQHFRLPSFVENTIIANKTGSGVPRIVLKNFKTMCVLVPCLEEQQKIADFLSAYDEAISYAKQELEHWKQLKKGLLQQMFV